MAGQQSTLIKGYPYSNGGDRMRSAVDRTGPTSYATFTAGSPPTPGTGGDVIAAAEFGLKYFDEISMHFDSSGTYNVVATLDQSLGQPPQTATLVWYVASTGAQVANAVNLSAAIVRIVAVGQPR